MNDLGMTLVWSAVQVTLVLIPAALLHALASRRSPASGSWIATVGLALSVAIGVATFVPRAGTRQCACRYIDGRRLCTTSRCAWPGREYERHCPRQCKLDR